MLQHIKRILFVVLFILTTQYLYGQNDTYKIKKVVIDAGHGGKDPGTVGRIGQEKKVVLAVALKLGEMIKQKHPDITVIYTRKTDVYIPLDKRAEIANNEKADLFISIHANALPGKPNTTGAETYILGLHKSEEQLKVAQRENAVMLMDENYTSKYQGFEPNSAESYIIFQLMQNIYLDQSLSFATQVQKELDIKANRKDRGVKQAGFWVLHQTSMPSALVEIGFMSNTSEEKYLLSKKGQTQLAQGILNAFTTYKNKVENKASEFIEQPPISYKIQIASRRSPIASDLQSFFGIENVEEHYINKKYKYTVGNENQYNKIKKLHAKIKNKIQDSFIVAFIGDKPISLEEAKKHTNN